VHTADYYTSDAIMTSMTLTITPLRRLRVVMISGVLVMTASKV
jgi:hypothetical protein